VTRLAGRRGFLAALGMTVACRGVARSQEAEEPPEIAPEPTPPPQAVFENVTVTLEVARTDQERQKGLGGHVPLGETDGMLFVFERPSFYAFWMKGMLFALDMLWIENGQVVHIERNVPNYPLETPDLLLPVYAPRAPATYVLEVNPGFTERYGIEVGAAVELLGI
jgi:hypothetical protein